ncbi:MAG: hypothetical protein M1825_003971 [Sarcosagium campestre]|nr:MAG: hypothetical protein M1825_003971 [Sarcosagium campestre]
MNSSKSKTLYICAQCRRAQSRVATFALRQPRRLISSTAARRGNEDANDAKEVDSNFNGSPGTMPDVQQDFIRRGAMFKRLSEMTAASLGANSTRARKIIEEAGFTGDLKRQLDAHMESLREEAERSKTFPTADSLLKPEAQAEHISSIRRASEGITRHDMSIMDYLSTLDQTLKDEDVKRYLAQQERAGDRRIDGGGRFSKERIAQVRAKLTAQALASRQNLSTGESDERAQRRKELKERFSPDARPMPTTLQGLASLANERIEDAIARGQFKNLPRGKEAAAALAHDSGARNPFLDTTEYFLNKMIQKQEMVPPWIEKQQELVSAVAAFRNRLRADWRRHAARTIASGGGSLDEQIRRADAYADAERDVALRRSHQAGTATKDNVETLASVDDYFGKKDAEFPDDHLRASSGVFRDPEWERTEHAYLSLSIRHINNLTRSYNLQAPALAHKPYYTLDRELRACFADVAPRVADEIRQRAAAPPVRIEIVGHRPGGMLERFAAESAPVWDSTRPHYGIREFWADLWRSSSPSSSSSSSSSSS